MADSARVINVSLTFVHTEPTEALKTYATDKVKHCLQKFVRQDTEAHVVLKVEKNRQIAEVTFHADGADFTANKESADLYSSIDLMVDSVGEQLRRHKDKITSHH